MTDPSLQPLHGYKSILRAPSRSITLTGLLARETTQGDHHKTTRRQAGSHLAMPLKQKLGNRGRRMARAASQKNFKKQTWPSLQEETLL